MVLYTLIAAITLVLACQIKTTAYADKLISRQKAINVVSMSAISIILIALAAFRLEVGNDYGTYVVTCHEIFQKGYVVTEPGYNLVVRILYTLSGKEDYLLMFAVFGAAIVCVFLKSFKEQSDNFAISFFLFMALGIYFRSYNTVRYYFALALALYSLRYVVGFWEGIDWQELIKFLVLIGFAATFHKSVLVVIPLYMLAGVKWNKWIIGIVCAGGLIAFICSSKLLEIALKLYPSYKDTVYLEQSHSILENAPVIARCLLVLLLCIVCYKESIEDHIANRTYMNLNVMAIVLYLSCWWLPLVTRIAYYLITPQVLLVPGVIMSVKDSEKRKRLLYITIFVGIMYFVYFLFTANHDGVRVLPYKSWLFYEHRWLNHTDTFGEAV